jgi:hypothetical protein
MGHPKLLRIGEKGDCKHFDDTQFFFSGVYRHLTDEKTVKRVDGSINFQPPHFQSSIKELGRDFFLKKEMLCYT